MRLSFLRKMEGLPLRPCPHAGILLEAHPVGEGTLAILTHHHQLPPTPPITVSPMSNANPVGALATPRRYALPASAPRNKFMQWMPTMRPMPVTLPALLSFHNTGRNPTSTHRQEYSSPRQPIDGQSLQQSIPRQEHLSRHHSNPHSLQQGHHGYGQTGRCWWQQSIF